ncbi:MAG: PDZ domain-containing protein [Nitrospirota bacterium]|jgi:general secretion pathway protein C
MQQNRVIPAAVWIAFLTITAYMLAQGAAVIISRNFDTASRNAATIEHHRLDRVAPPLPGLNASPANRTASVPRTDAAGSVKVEQVSDTQWIVDRGSMLANTRNLNRFLMQARTVPYTKRGKVAGFRITRISPGSIYEKIGLQNGDVLLRVNTQNLDNPAKLFSLYKEMRNKRHISLLLSRNGQDRTFQYDIR